MTPVSHSKSEIILHISPALYWKKKCWQYPTVNLLKVSSGPILFPLGLPCNAHDINISKPWSLNNLLFPVMIIWSIVYNVKTTEKQTLSILFRQLTSSQVKTRRGKTFLNYIFHSMGRHYWRLIMQMSTHVVTVFMVSEMSEAASFSSSGRTFLDCIESAPCAHESMGQNGASVRISGAVFEQPRMTHLRHEPIRHHHRRRLNRSGKSRAAILLVLQHNKLTNIEHFQ